MNVVIVDDERLARVELRRLLAIHRDVTVVGEAADPKAAVALIDRMSPDLLLLDIEMPGMSGFDLLERLDDVPSVIVTTAYDTYAIRAFEVNAIDYLLKPIVPERLGAALARAAEREASIARGAFMQRLFVRDGDRCWIVRLSDVSLLESEGNYSRLHFGNHRPLVRRSLNGLLNRLDPVVFARANRSQAVNLAWVQSTAQAGSGGLTVTLRTGRLVEFSRRRSLRLREVLRP